MQIFKKYYLTMLHEKNGFAEKLKNLSKYKFKNNFNGSSK